MSNSSKSKTANRAEELDSRYHLAAGLRRQMNKVFPTHWSFMLGEIALYSFIVLLLTGVYLTWFFDPSMQEVTYNGVYEPLKNVSMSRAFESTLNISFEVRGGLFVRQLHHWAALLFAASIMIHLARIFFTGAFRKPREANWVIGCFLMLLAFFEGFFGYSLPDDLLSGTGVRAAMSGIVLSIPLIGSWLHWLLFGGMFPGEVVVSRMYALHILIIPGLILALIGIHLALVWYQKHTQFPGPGRTESNVVGVRIMPIFGVKSGAFFAITLAVLSIMAGIFQINPVWALGPYNPAQVSAGSQPDIYMMFTDGLVRLWPAWEIYIGGHTIPGVFGAVIVLGIVFGLLFAYPFIESKLTKDYAAHNLLQRPRDVPVRTALGVAAIGFYAVMTLSCMNDIIAFQFQISLNALTWVGRIGLLVIPPLLYFITYRICLGLQYEDRDTLNHGVETGIVKMSPNGEFFEVHQPLGPTDEHGHQTPLPYEGASIPKKMNKLGFAGKPGSGSLLIPDKTDEQKLLLELEKKHKQQAKEALEKLQNLENN